MMALASRSLRVVLVVLALLATWGVVPTEAQARRAQPQALVLCETQDTELSNAVQLFESSLAAVATASGFAIVREVSEGADSGLTKVLCRLRPVARKGIRGTALVSTTLEVDLWISEGEGDSARTLLRHKQEFSGYASDWSSAWQMAAKRGGESLRPRVAKALAPKQAGPVPGIPLIVRGMRGLDDLRAIMQQVAITRGVEGLHIVDMQDRQVRLAVESSDGIANLQASLRRTRIKEAFVQVQRVGDTLQFVIGGTQPSG